jgi:hypothetical protein
MSLKVRLKKLEKIGNIQITRCNMGKSVYQIKMKESIGICIIFLLFPHEFPQTLYLNIDIILELCRSQVLNQSAGRTVLPPEL